MANLTNAAAEAIVSGKVNAAVHRGLAWHPLNVRKDGTPSKIEGRVRVEAQADDAFELLMRIQPDKPWMPTVILLHKVSGANVRRLDIRGTHLDRSGGEQWINQTHKHRWSEESENRDVYTPIDIRHHLGIPVVNGMKDLADEYQRVFEDFAGECRIALATGYIWKHPPYPEPDQPFPSYERYP